MNEGTQPEVVSTLEDDTGARIVDILRHPAGHFSYVELHRDPANEDAWREVAAKGQTYPTEFAAYSAAMRDVDWLLD